MPLLPANSSNSTSSAPPTCCSCLGVSGRLLRSCMQLQHLTWLSTNPSGGVAQELIKFKHQAVHHPPACCLMSEWALQKVVEMLMWGDDACCRTLLLNCVYQVNLMLTVVYYRSPWMSALATGDRCCTLCSWLSPAC